MVIFALCSLLGQPVIAQQGEDDEAGAEVGEPDASDDSVDAPTDDADDETLPEDEIGEGQEGIGATPEPEGPTEFAIVNMSASFVQGPYSAIAVDPTNPDRIAVATETGMVAFSENGGLFTRDSTAISMRRYDSMALRGGARMGLSLKLNSTKRATRMFIQMLRSGVKTARWAYWMMVTEPYPFISDITLPARGSKLAIAAPAGILVSDAGASTWHRVVGGPGPMQRDNDTMGMSVAIDPRDPKHLIAATDHGVLESKNGGYTFAPHPDPLIEEQYVFRFFWDPSQPDLVFALTDGEVLLSEDGAKSFQPAFAPAGSVRDLSISGDSVFVSTSDGLTVVGSDGTSEHFKGKDILGAVGLVNGVVIAVTGTTIYALDPKSGNTMVIGQTTTTDPYLRVAGGPTQAWVLSKQAILRVGAPIEREAGPAYKAPKLLMTARQVQSAVLKRTELGEPENDRLHQRWYGKLLPRVVFEYEGVLDNGNHLKYDATFPVSYRHADGYSEQRGGFVVWAMWDLSSVVFGDAHASNPFALLENNLRTNRKMLFEEVNWRYREAAALVKSLEKPPTDPSVELAWRSRLAEYTAYLEFMSGRNVVANNLE